MASLNRIVMQKASRAMLRKLHPAKLECIEISGTTGRRLPFKTYRNAFFPDYDICAGPFKDAQGAPWRADVVMANQVWEHLDRPYAAIGHVRQMLRPGGYFWLACPFLVRIHGAPVDCSRWTARGMQNLLIETGFAEDQIVSFEWGNRAAVVRNTFGKFPPEFSREHDDLQNEPGFPVAVWALARLEGGPSVRPLEEDLAEWTEEA
ncbi:methyltransferase domain-containing protein [Primorskyibacter sp. S187A]|uniref:methyltransferase domain-containing protein n=1 Tax=Primorskyibacter sp. S187A TaxID=3415130 RepID=UPI003C7B193C